MYEQATREPYSFLFARYLKRNEMFYKRFEERFALEKDSDGAALSFLSQKLFVSSTFFPFYSARRCLAAAPSPGRSRDSAPCTVDICRGSKQGEEPKGKKGGHKDTKPSQVAFPLINALTEINHVLRVRVNQAMTGSVERPTPKQP